MLSVRRLYEVLSVSCLMLTIAFKCYNFFEVCHPYFVSLDVEGHNKII